MATSVPFSSPQSAAQAVIAHRSPYLIALMGDGRLWLQASDHKYQFPSCLGQNSGTEAVKQHARSPRGGLPGSGLVCLTPAFTPPAPHTCTYIYTHTLL